MLIQLLGRIMKRSIVYNLCQWVLYLIKSKNHFIWESNTLRTNYHYSWHVKNPVNIITLEKIQLSSEITKFRVNFCFCFPIQNDSLSITIGYFKLCRALSNIKTMQMIMYMSLISTIVSPSFEFRLFSALNFYTGIVTA